MMTVAYMNEGMIPHEEVRDGFRYKVFPNLIQGFLASPHNYDLDRLIHHENTPANRYNFWDGKLNKPEEGNIYICWILMWCGTLWY
jgi:hypothetical protein